MTIRNFTTWCETAVADIIFPPDREAVYEELMNHLNDHYDDLVAQGVDRETARQMALDAMGDAQEIAPQLAAIHRPFWGYFLRITRVLLVLSLCAALLCTWIAFRRANYSSMEDNYLYDLYGDVYHTDVYTTNTRLFLTEPNLTAQSDGYTLTLTKAAVWNVNYLDGEKELHDFDVFHCQLRVYNPRPWAEHDDVASWFWAVDSLGNVYDRHQMSIRNYAPFITVNEYHTAPLTYEYHMEIDDYRSQEAEWIEFHYDRSGRDIVFRIDLTGGDAA